MVRELELKFDEKLCLYCKRPIKEWLNICPICGSSQVSEKKWSTTLFLLLLFPGIHRLYAINIKNALLFGITFGGFGIWWLIDLINILTGNFKDKYGKPIKNKLSLSNLK